MPSTAALTSLNEQNPTETGENFWPVSVTYCTTNCTGVLVVAGVVATAIRNIGKVANNYAKLGINLNDEMR